MKAKSRAQLNKAQRTVTRDDPNRNTANNIKLLTALSDRTGDWRNSGGLESCFRCEREKKKAKSKPKTFNYTLSSWKGTQQNSDEYVQY